MKTFILTATLIMLAAPALAQTPPAQPNPQQQQMNAMQSTLLQSDQSRMDAYTRHQTIIQKAFKRSGAPSPSGAVPQAGGANLNAIAPAAGGGMPTYDPNEGVAMRSRLQQEQYKYQHPGVADSKDLPLMTGNIPAKR